MTWGAQYMCYTCKKCGKKYRYAIDLIGDYGPDYGKCPVCGIMGTYEFDGARMKNDKEYEEIDETYF